MGLVKKTSVLLDIPPLQTHATVLHHYTVLKPGSRGSLSPWSSGNTIRSPSPLPTVFFYGLAGRCCTGTLTIAWKFLLRLPRPAQVLSGFLVYTGMVSRNKTGVLLLYPGPMGLPDRVALSPALGHKKG